MQAQERALAQANDLITMALVLLLLAGGLVVAMTAVLSTANTSFSSEDAESAPAALSSAFQTSILQTDRDAVIASII